MPAPSPIPILERVLTHPDTARPGDLGAVRAAGTVRSAAGAGAQQAQPVEAIGNRERVGLVIASSFERFRWQDRERGYHPQVYTP